MDESAITMRIKITLNFIINIIYYPLFIINYLIKIKINY